jgi:ATP-dependent DNA ligase
MLRQPAALTAAGVLATLRRIAAEHGPGCAARKKGLVLGLLRAARGCEVRHVTFKP